MYLVRGIGKNMSTPSSWTRKSPNFKFSWCNMGLPFPPLALFSKYNSVFPILQQPLLQHIKPSVFSSPRAGLACPSDSRLGNSLRSLPCLEPRFRTCISHLPGASLCPEAAHLPRTSSERALRAHVLETCLVIMTRQGPSQSENHVCW